MTISANGRIAQERRIGGAVDPEREGTGEVGGPGETERRRVIQAVVAAVELERRIEVHAACGASGDEGRL